MTHTEFFNWLRSMQTDKRLSQAEVDTANALLETTSADELKAWLIDINGWRDGSASHGMKLSDNGLAIIKKFEGFVAKPYRDAVGIWTIGYGNTYYTNGKKVTANDKSLTEAEASQLKLDIINQDFAPAINLMLKNEIANGKITQNMFDALVSLGYNIGVGALAKSSVIRHLKNGDKQASADSFLLWNKAGGKVLKGLVNRRNAERQLFLG
ncbi:lysozyme [Moraxella boevrei]|uniref:lysozyme n=1 Tax=Faucicola boevrei TaxID=346665 RepID=UPI003736E73C